MLSNVIEAVLARKGKNISSFAKDTGCSQPNLSQKSKRDSYYLKEAVLIANYINSDLAFIDRETGEVIGKFNLNDISN